MRSNVRDNFEDIYLKSNEARKSFSNLTIEKTNQYTSNSSFKKCVGYIANSTYTKNSRKLEQCGYNREDINQLTLIYALVFVGSNYPHQTDKDFYYIMMRFINQRFMNFFIRFNAKFSSEINELPMLLNDAVHSLPTDEDDTVASSLEVKVKVLLDIKACIDFWKLLSKQFNSESPEYKSAHEEIAQYQYLKNYFRKKYKNKQTIPKSTRTTLNEKLANTRNVLAAYVVSVNISPEVRFQIQLFCMQCDVDLSTIPVNPENSTLFTD